MQSLIPIVRTVRDLQNHVKQWKADGLTVGMVPTMGALHHGHLSLVSAIATKVDKIVVSIFVNPTQFGPSEDLAKYPRQEQADREALGTTSASLIYAPTAAEMYPEGHATTVSVAGISATLEGAIRPGHFDGVATVVSKLLMQCQPHVAIFGEKDYQQLAVIRRMVQDLHLPVDIMAGTLIRETDGLAASSRNAYLSTEERRIAGKLNLILRDLITRVAQEGIGLRTAEAQATAELLTAGFTAVDYVTVVHGNSLKPLDQLEPGARLLAVARCGTVRLLDNMPVELL